jgi:hexosaminidase
VEHAVIPAPLQFEVANGPGFVFQPGTAIAYSDPGITPVVERFCAQLTRRTGVCLAPALVSTALVSTARVGTARGGTARGAAPDGPSVIIELGAAGELDELPGTAGLWPAGGEPADERYSLLIDAGRVVLRAAEPAGVARGLTTLIQLAATAPPGDAGEIRVPAVRILDAPRYAWRGLSLDVARTFFTVEEIRRVIDLLEFYKLSVLHLHLTDDQAWRLPMGRPVSGEPRPGDDFYREEDLRVLAAYATDRFVTVVPEIDTPGHATALMRLHPELNTGRNEVDYEILPGHERHAVWLDPELPATFGLMEQVLAGVAAIFPGPYLHIGADEPRGMPDEAYLSYVRRLRGLVRSLGRRPLGWQETARAGLRPDDVIQFWLTGIELPPDVPPQVRAQVDAELALARRDVEAAVSVSVPVIVSPLPYCYLDVPYAEPLAGSAAAGTALAGTALAGTGLAGTGLAVPGLADAAQANRLGRLGLRVYAPRTVAESFGWDPGEALGPGRAGQVAGVEAAIWAETITGFDDLTFLLLPRLPGVAGKAWSTRPPAGPPDAWPAHRERLARHGRLWAQDGLTYFRASTVNWD